MIALCLRCFFLRSLSVGFEADAPPGSSASDVKKALTTANIVPPEGAKSVTPDPNAVATESIGIKTITCKGFVAVISILACLLFTKIVFIE
jgi:hypothetical protein